MYRRLFHRCALWLLPLLVARAFVPVGFMLSASEHGLRLEFCPAQSAALVHALASFPGHVSNHAGHGIAHADATADQDQKTHQHDESEALQATCPFGLATAANTFDIPALRSVAPGPSDERSKLDVAWSATAGPLRADRIRGPPTYS